MTTEAAPELGVEYQDAYTFDLDHAVVDAGTYPATFMGIRPFTIDLEEGGTRDLLSWGFQIADELVEGTTSVATGPKSKAYRWLSALVGMERMRQRGKIISGELVGTACLVSVEVTADGYSRIQEVLPPMAS